LFEFWLRAERRPLSDTVPGADHDGAVPRISVFYGIVITMYFYDHEPPHFHAQYAERRAAIAIETGAVLVGELPSRALKLVSEWAALHRLELEANWGRAKDGGAPEPIDPLP
jgi:hypothetical protein